VSVDLVDLKPNLSDSEFTLPTFKSKKSLQYSVKTNQGLTYGRDVNLIKSSVELDDNLLGFDDIPDEFDFLESRLGNQFWKPYDLDVLNNDHPNMLFYWNFIMINE
jgi:hypothetical protein